MIGGYSRSEVKGKPFSSLLLGTFEEGKLIYAGKVGTGFDSADFDKLSRKFRAARARGLAFRRGAVRSSARGRSGSSPSSSLRSTSPSGHVTDG